MHLKSNSHIGGIVISAALALAQRDGWTGEQLLKAIVGGYEASSLLGVAVQQSPGYNRHIRPSGICGAFGAAVNSAFRNQTRAFPSSGWSFLIPKIRTIFLLEQLLQTLHWCAV